PARATVSAPVTQLADASLCARRYQLLHELRLEERPDREPCLPDPLGEEPGAPATALGTLAHRLLELVPLRLDAEARRAELSRLMEISGEDPSRHTEVLDAACAFLDSPLGRRMAQAPPERLQRELPFTLRIESPEVEALVRGQIDALLIDGEGATVVDYKLSQARDPQHYAAQLDAYALAARELLRAAPLQVRTGIVFLRTKGAPFAERQPAAEDEIRARLLSAAKAIADGRRTGVWSKVEIARCHELRCGFVNRCHPGQID